MDKVIIKDLLARGIIGINEWERENAQDILINIVVLRIRTARQRRTILRTAWITGNWPRPCNCMRKRHSG